MGPQGNPPDRGKASDDLQSLDLGDTNGGQQHAALKAGTAQGGSLDGSVHG
jgi:hypothetical protein